MDIKFIEKENDRQNETTRYWFDVDGVEYCIVDCKGELELLDHNGFTIESVNDHDRIKEALLPHYEIAKFEEN